MAHIFACRGVRTQRHGTPENDTVWFMSVQGNRAVARDVLVRVVQIGLAIGLGMMLLIFNCRLSIPRIFSQDPAVVKIAANTLVVIAFYLVRYLHTVLPLREACVESLRFQDHSRLPNNLQASCLTCRLHV